MRIFLYELKKIWNIKVLIIIAAFAFLTWFALIAEGLRSYESLKYHGAYGSFQTEMFELYGATLEPQEIEDFDFARRFAEINAEAEAIIAREPVFAEYGINNFEEFLEWYNSGSYWVRVDDSILVNGELNPENYDRMDMQNLLNGGETVEQWYASPINKLQCLSALEWRYNDSYSFVDVYIESDMRPPVVRAAERLKQTNNNSLINEYLLPYFSLYAAITGVFAVAAVIILIIPLLITDRSRRINMLQYSSKTGRKILRIQFTATLTSAFILSAVLVTLIFIPFIKAASEYWSVSIMSSGIRGMWLYDITFGQYAMLLAGTILVSCVGAAGFAFILARFSSNIVNAMIKAVPAGAAFAALLGISVFMALSNNNIVFNQVFGGRFDMPEVILCGAVGLVGTIAAVLIVRRERRRDLL